MTISSSLLISALLFAGPDEPTAGSIDVESVVVTLIKTVDVPAREVGVLASIKVREGDLVKRGELLAQIDDTEVRMAVRRAEVEVEIAREKAGNDIAVRFARKKSEVAATELKRAGESRKKLRNSVSDTEYDRLKLLDQESILQIEQAGHELSAEKLNLKLKQSDLEIAQHEIERRQIFAPLTGVVEKVNHQEGEWVETGTSLLRILRVDRLRAEGFIRDEDVVGNPVGRRATLTISRRGRPGARFVGKIVFVSTEINPVNGQIRFWAEFDNPNLALRPGMKGSLIIHSDRVE